MELMLRRVCDTVVNPSSRVRPNPPTARRLPQRGKRRKLLLSNLLRCPYNFRVGVSASTVAVLNARADDVGSRIHWEMHVRAGGDPESVGLTAGAGHVFIYGPVRLDDRAVAHIYALLDALLRRERCIVEDENGHPRLV